MSQRSVFIVSAGIDVGSALARGLAASGASVALLSDSETLMVDGDAAAAGVEHLACDASSRESLEQAFAAAVERVGPPSQVVVSVLPLLALQPVAIHEMTAAQWQAACGGAMKAMLHVLQAAFTHMGERGGSVVALGPALSLAGAPQLAALSAAVEGQRGLVKSAARQWGRRGLTVNWVAAAPRALSPLFESLPLPVKPDAVMVALGCGPALDEGLAGVIDFLGSPAGRALTGTTLVADGGEWMVP
ncbi:MAG TPA: SDR family oxidoreductase [Ideonella sp.]|jgi:NAD(P)-dependent dehydrogenase (short-subunit alcohol dehydrogenase family)|nr:SDR family oxidoreductase [Ideonella sp.]